MVCFLDEMHQDHLLQLSVNCWKFVTCCACNAINSREQGNHMLFVCHQSSACKFHCFSAAFRGQKCAIFQANQVIPGCVVILMCSVNGTHTTWKSAALSGTFWVMVAATITRITALVVSLSVPSHEFNRVRSSVRGKSGGRAPR